MTCCVSIESPYHSEDEDILKRNICYAIMACRHASLQGEAPFASHLILTQFVVNGKHYYAGDHVEDLFGLERDAAIELTHSMREKMDKIVFYMDLGESSGMKAARELARQRGIPTEDRLLPESMMKQVLPPIAETH